MVNYPHKHKATRSCLQAHWYSHNPLHKSIRSTLTGALGASKTLALPLPWVWAEQPWLWQYHWCRPGGSSNIIFPCWKGWKTRVLLWGTPTSFRIADCFGLTTLLQASSVRYAIATGSKGTSDTAWDIQSVVRASFSQISLWSAWWMQTQGRALEWKWILERCALAMFPTYRWGERPPTTSFQFNSLIAPIMYKNSEYMCH